MAIVIVEGTNTYTMEMTYQELVEALNYAKKERERHRVKSLRQYYKKKALKEETETTPPVTEA